MEQASGGVCQHTGPNLARKLGIWGCSTNRWAIWCGYSSPPGLSIRSWRGLLKLFTKPLKYHRETNSTGDIIYVGREKGIDVMMALDIAIGAINGEYDVAVAVTADTDLVPALEHALAVGRRVETATWQKKKSLCQAGQRHPLTWQVQRKRTVRSPRTS
ncbi:NYN domain-containing protein [Candidatus Poriferisocius sp.]|uniref:NYN domain-containing protein n=1 Tax=Candidatus Poriferisocius sp. TaxID=3101276 RepID=UPI003B02762E